MDQNELPTTHPKPTYLFDSVEHYCVTNITGAVLPKAA